MAFVTFTVGESTRPIRNKHVGINDRVNLHACSFPSGPRRSDFGVDFIQCHFGQSGGLCPQIVKYLPCLFAGHPRLWQHSGKGSPRTMRALSSRTP